ncbi:DUF3784 domain-containing protein [Mucilaginibacter ginsenosidivorax]|uniref:DUF3784 domain-containing protein n=1 Tax=Mucilaginibacter ginsenosidivorax TaxID=862126 RepID=A0A5B8W7P3_9SPHI|nr:DUF3784 domain-containing protein [Mucilaginibacter ginsenosidivorax]QEC78248.1 DUF3784 domain-containing protein [Mucilaginibacter ginsenosidivorax]
MLNLCVFGTIALVMLLFGYQIKYKKKASLISGFDENLVSDVNGLCNWVGNLMLINAAIALLTGIGMTYLPAQMNIILIFFVVGILATSVFAIAGKRRFGRQ